MNKEDIWEAKRKKYMERIAEMCLMNDSFMSVVLEDKQCCELVINTILNRTDIKVMESRSQYSMTNLHGRSVRLDVLAVDSENKHYNIEIQRSDQGAVPERARYNSSIIDANISDTGEKYKDLPEVYVIFITENDIFRKNKPVYTVERTILETGDLFGDRSHIIYVNSSIQDETALGQLMSDFYCKDPVHIKNKLLAEKTGYYKFNKEGGRVMCRIIEEIVKEERNEARAEGREEQRIEIAVNFIKAKTISADEIARMCNLPIEKVNELIVQHGE